MQWETPPVIFARTAFTADGWQRDVTLHIAADGTIAALTPDSGPPAAAPAFDLVLPGMSNVHSHAFQRAMGGLTEIASGAGRDNFWSWREVMYAFTHRLTPEHIEAIAQAFYIDLLKRGYTSVGEFHYMHHDADGTPYADPAELSARVVAGAAQAGIHLALLPVMYETGNFGGAPANQGQRRFLHTADGYLRLLETLRTRYGASANITLGIAPHSLRAVTPEALQQILAALPALGLGDCPVHMHISEQEKEVADCLAWSGRRPTEWLFENVAVDGRWCLIHATHTTEQEIRRIASSGATIGFCPTTEANLGDGIFLAETYLAANGSFGIGSDSNVCVSPWEELRMMEYVQRLATRKRTVLCTTDTPSVGRTLFSRAAAGGAKALGIKAGALAVGMRADLMALATTDALLAEKKADGILDTLIFAVTPQVTDVFVGGKRVIAQGRHALEAASNAALRTLTLLSS